MQAAGLYELQNNSLMTSLASHPLHSYNKLYGGSLMGGLAQLPIANHIT